MDLSFSRTSCFPASDIPKISTLFPAMSAFLSCAISLVHLEPHAVMKSQQSNMVPTPQRLMWLVCTPTIIALSP